ncbi:hypothetical protein HBH69_144130 [Parastagonospora nodorum]|nr:hypothetical protein HBH69_144130 [Parastagonospora nodorum]
MRTNNEVQVQHQAKSCCARIWRMELACVRERKKRLMALLAELVERKERDFRKDQDERDQDESGGGG